MALPSTGCSCEPEAFPDISKIEEETGLTIGVYIAGRALFAGYRDYHRFALCSTFKWILAAAILREAERGHLRLDQVISYSKADLVPHAPVTEKHLTDGRLRVDQLCHAILVHSDNVAANLLLRQIGGPEAVTQFCRDNGDTVTRLDRYETELNSNLSGDERDTTTPEAMSRLMQHIFTGESLSRSHTRRLEGWMRESQTGKAMIRAGTPENAVVADKTGRGANGAVNDVAIIRMPEYGPLFLGIYTTGGTLTPDQHNAVIAKVTTYIFKNLRLKA
ncbi:MAG: class A beta-lactamase [Asticcacaulis sp.]